jgi:hypothetical protein
MGLTGTFNLEDGSELLKFTSIRGYIISAAFIPDQGYQGHFYVYVFDVHEARNPFTEKMKVGDPNAASPALRGTLELSGEDRNYKFEKIDFTMTETGATRRERFRILEFRYDRNLTDKEKLSAELSQASPTVLMPGALKDDYTFILDDGSEKEHLLGLTARLGPEDSAVVRFAKYRNLSNSMMEKVLALNNDRVSVLGSARAMADFKLTFGFANDPIPVTRSNLLRVFTHEAYGLGLYYQLPTLTGLITGGAGPEKARLSVDSLTPYQLLLHDSEKDSAAEAATRTVETTTLVFQKGYLRDLPVA